MRDRLLLGCTSPCNPPCACSRPLGQSKAYGVPERAIPERRLGTFTSTCSIFSSNLRQCCSGLSRTAFCCRVTLRKADRSVVISRPLAAGEPHSPDGTLLHPRRPTSSSCLYIQANALKRTVKFQMHLLRKAGEPHTVVLMRIAYGHLASGLLVHPQPSWGTDGYFSPIALLTTRRDPLLDNILHVREDVLVMPVRLATALWRSLGYLVAMICLLMGLIIRRSLWGSRRRN